MTNTQIPEIVGYVVERHLPSLQPTFEVYARNPHFGERTAALIRLNEHEALVAELRSQSALDKQDFFEARQKAALFDNLREGLQEAGLIPADTAAPSLAEVLITSLRKRRNGRAAGGPST